MNKTVKVFLADNAYLYKDLNNNYYSSGIYDNLFFERYLKVFDKIKFVAKIKMIDNMSNEIRYEKIKTNDLEVIELPAFKGMKELLKNLFLVLKILKKATKDCDGLVLRMLQFEGIICWIYRYRKPYIVEVVNNPISEKRFSGIIKKILIDIHHIIINKADGVSYVTEKTLQKLFPYKGKGFQTAYSSIELPNQFIMTKKEYINKLEEVKIVHVANTISGNSKGHYTILNIINKLLDKGVTASCYFYGEGKSVQDLKMTAASLGISRQIHFMGYVSGREELINELRKYDIFVFPSISEGMPRCLIEACAAGLPCLASEVGGIPEIISNEFLIRNDDIEGYCKKIIYLMNHPDKLSYMSETNVKSAEFFKKSRLDRIRTDFYMEFLNTIL